MTDKLESRPQLTSQQANARLDQAGTAILKETITHGDGDAYSGNLDVIENMQRGILAGRPYSALSADEQAQYNRWKQLREQETYYINAAAELLDEKRMDDNSRYLRERYPNDLVGIQALAKVLKAYHAERIEMEVMKSATETRGSRLSKIYNGTANKAFLPA